MEVPYQLVIGMELNFIYYKSLTINNSIWDILGS